MHLKNDCKQTEIWKVLTEFLREHFVSEWATYYIIYLYLLIFFFFFHFCIYLSICIIFLSGFCFTFSVLFWVLPISTTIPCFFQLVFLEGNKDLVRKYDL